MPSSVITYYVLGLCCFAGARAGPNEKALHEMVLQGYNPMTRPVLNESMPVNVKLGLNLQQVIDVDEKNQILVTNVWLTFDWVDEQLTWDPRDYNNIEEIRISPKAIWTPDVLLYNSVDESFNTFYQANVVVKYTGDLQWIPPGIVKSSCKINIAWFPFDEQKCILKFGSWTYGGGFMELSLGLEDTSTYTTNGEWKLIDLNGTRNEIFYDCCPDPYYDITFTIWVRRRTLYYGFNLIIPCLLIALMALLDFILPPDAGEKLTLGITVFMSLCVFLLMVAEAMPPTSEAVPLIGVYFSTIMIIVSASQVFTVLVLNFHYRDPDMHDMPETVRTVFHHWLPWLLMMKKPNFLVEKEEEEKQEARMQNLSASASFGTEATSVPLLSLHHSHVSMDGASKSLLANILDTDDDTVQKIRLYNNQLAANSRAAIHAVNANGQIPRSVSMQPNHTNSLSREPPKLQLAIPPPQPVAHPELSDAVWEALASVETNLAGIHKELKVITNKLKEDDETDEMERDWRFAAIVLDRLCLILFTTVFSVATCGIIFSAPQLIV